MIAGNPRRLIVTTQYAIKVVRPEARSYITNAIYAGRSGVGYFFL